MIREKQRRNCMIFLSHNSKDKRIVEPFANKLAEVFGRDNVFMIVGQFSQEMVLLIRWRAD